MVICSTKFLFVYILFVYILVVALCAKSEVEFSTLIAHREADHVHLVARSTNKEVSG